MNDELEKEELKEEINLMAGHGQAVKVEKDLPLTMRLYDPKNPMAINALKDILDPEDEKEKKKKPSLIAAVASIMEPENKSDSEEDEMIDMANFLDPESAKVSKSKEDAVNESKLEDLSDAWRIQMKTQQYVNRNVKRKREFEIG